MKKKKKNGKRIRVRTPTYVEIMEYPEELGDPVEIYETGWNAGEGEWTP